MDRLPWALAHQNPCLPGDCPAAKSGVQRRDHFRDAGHRPRHDRSPDRGGDVHRRWLRPRPPARDPALPPGRPESPRRWSYRQRTTIPGQTKGGVLPSGERGTTGSGDAVRPFNRDLGAYGRVQAMKAAHGAHNITDRRPRYVRPCCPIPASRRYGRYRVGPSRGLGRSCMPAVPCQVPRAPAALSPFRW